LSGTALLPLVLPILPPDGLERYQATLGVAPPRMENKKYGALPQHLADMFGWEELRDAVAWAALQIEPGERAAVFTQNYGEAAALELFGSAGLPVISGHNSYYLWGRARRPLRAADRGGAHRGSPARLRRVPRGVARARLGMGDAVRARVADLALPQAAAAAACRLAPGQALRVRRR